MEMRQLLDNISLPLTVLFNRALYWFAFVVSSFTLVFLAYKSSIEIDAILSSDNRHRALQGITFFLACSAYYLIYAIRRLIGGKVALIVHKAGIVIPARGTVIIPWANLHIGLKRQGIRTILQITSSELQKDIRLTSSDLRLRLQYIVDVTHQLAGRAPVMRHSTVVSAQGRKLDDEMSNPAGEDHIYNEFRAKLIFGMCLSIAVGLMAYYFFLLY